MFGAVLLIGAAVALVAGCSSPPASDADSEVMSVIADRPAADAVPGEHCPLFPSDFDLRRLVERHVDGQLGSLQGPMRHSSHIGDRRSGITQCAFLQEVTDASDGEVSVALIVVAAHSGMDHLNIAADDEGPMTVLGQGQAGNMIPLLQQPVPSAGGLLYQEPVGERSVITAFIDQRLSTASLGQELVAIVKDHLLTQQ